MLALIQLTVRESLAKRTFIAFFGISTALILLFIFALNLDIVDGAEAYISVFGEETNQAVDLYKIIFTVQGALAGALFTAGVFMSLFATSSLVPSILEKGNIDLLISKPLSRWQLLTSRYLGGVSVVAINIFYLIGGTFLVLSLKTGIWNWGFLAAGIMIVLMFAIYFALMTMLSVVIRSGPFSLMITYVVLFVSTPLLFRDQIYSLLSSKYYGYILDGVYHFLPKFPETTEILNAVVSGNTVESWFPLFTSMMFGVIMLTSANMIFQKKDF